MEEEHKKDLEALARLQRFLDSPAPSSKTNGVHILPADLPTTKLSTNEEAAFEDHGAYLIRAALAVVRSRPDTSFSPRAVQQALLERNFPLVGDERRQLVSIGQSLKKLAGRNEIRLVRHGKGREPNLYRALRTVMIAAPAGSEMTM